MSNNDGLRIIHDVDSFLPDVRSALQQLDGHPPRGGHRSGTGNFSHECGMPGLCPIHSPGSGLFGNVDIEAERHVHSDGSGISSSFSVRRNFGMGLGGIGVRMTMSSGMGGFRFQAQPFGSRGMFGQPRSRFPFGRTRQHQENSGNNDDSYNGPIITELSDEDVDDLEMDGNGTKAIEGPGAGSSPYVEENDSEDDREQDREPYIGPITSDISDYITSQPETQTHSRHEPQTDKSELTIQELNDDPSEPHSVNSSSSSINPRQNLKNKNTCLKKSTIKKWNKNETIGPSQQAHSGILDHSGMQNTVSNDGGKKVVAPTYVQRSTRPDIDGTFNTKNKNQDAYNNCEQGQSVAESELADSDPPESKHAYDKAVGASHISTNNSSIQTPGLERQHASRYLVADHAVDLNKVGDQQQREEHISQDDSHSLSFHWKDSTERGRAVGEQVDETDHSSFRQDDTGVDSQAQVCSKDARKQDSNESENIDHGSLNDDPQRKQNAATVKIGNESPHVADFPSFEVPPEHIDSAISATAMANDKESGHVISDVIDPEGDKYDMVLDGVNMVQLADIGPDAEMIQELHKIADVVDDQVEAFCDQDSTSDLSEIDNETSDSWTADTENGLEHFDKVNTAPKPLPKISQKVFKRMIQSDAVSELDEEFEDLSDDTSSNSYDCNEPHPNIKDKENSKSPGKTGRSADENVNYIDDFNKNWQYPSQSWEDQNQNGVSEHKEVGRRHQFTPACSHHLTAPHGHLHHVSSCCHKIVSCQPIQGPGRVHIVNSNHGSQKDEPFDHPDWQWLDEFSDPPPSSQRPFKNKNLSQPAQRHSGHKEQDAHASTPGHNVTDPSAHRQQPVGAEQVQHATRKRPSATIPYQERVKNLKEMVAKEGFDIYDVYYDGNCLFAAVVDQLRIRGDFRYTVTSLREAAVDYLKANPCQADGTPLLSFLTAFDGTWEQYLSRLSLNGEWGDHITVSAISNVLGRTLVILGGSTTLHRTVMEPFQTTTANQDQGREHSSQSNADGRQVPQTGGDDALEDLYLGHVVEAHYMSLRPWDWKQHFLECLKQKPALLFRDDGNPGKFAGSPIDIQLPHLNFVLMYTNLSNYFRLGNLPSLPDHPNTHKSKCTMHCTLRDGITSIQNLYSDHRHWLYPWTLLVEMQDSWAHSSDMPLHYCASKDLIVDPETADGAITRLMPVMPSLWLNRTVSVNGKVFLQQLFGEKKENYLERLIMFPINWPAESLHEFLHRTRPANWPPPQIVSEIADLPCGLIPSVHRTVQSGQTKEARIHSNLDWEYSFYNAEVCIGENVDSIQRFCFNAVLAVINMARYPDTLEISHLRHTFFYFCEETDSLGWTHNPMGCMLLLMDRLRHCYQIKVLPHYFMSHLNVLDTWTGDANAMEGTLRLILQNPLPMVYFMLDYHKVFMLDKIPVFDRVMEDLQRYRDHRDIHVSMAGCFMPQAVEGISRYIVSKQFNQVHHKSVLAISALESVSKAAVNVTLDGLICKALKSSEHLLYRWLCAFVLDQLNGTTFTEEMNREFPTVSIFNFFGEDLRNRLRSHEDIMIPSVLVEMADLAEMASEFMDVLEIELCIPKSEYCTCASYFCQHYGMQIMEFLQTADMNSYMRRIQMNSLKIILFKMEIFMNERYLTVSEEQIRQICLTAEELGKEYLAKASSHAEKHQHEQTAQYTEAAQKLLDLAKQAKQSRAERAAAMTTKV